MNLLRTALVLGLLEVNSWAAPAVLGQGQADKERPRPKFTISKETTHVTEPLGEDGWPDFEAALNRRLSQGVTPRTNANVLLWQALGPAPEGTPVPAEFFRRLGMPAPKREGDFYLAAHRKEPRASQRPWTSREHPALAAWLKANEKPLALVVEATKRPGYYNPMVSRKDEKDSAGLISALQPGVQKCRDLAGALLTRAMLHAGEGRHDEAWQDLLGSHRLGRLVGRGATLVEALLGRSIEQQATNASLAFIERANLTPRQVQACLRDLRGLPPMAQVADKIDLGERFMYLDGVRFMQRQGAAGFKDADGKVIGPQAVARLDWDTILRDGNRWYDRTAAALRYKDRADRENELETMDEEFKKLKDKVRSGDDVARALAGAEGLDKAMARSIGYVLLSLYAPATRRLQHGAERAEQVHRNLHVAFALAAYRHEHRRYPASLDALAPAYLPRVPEDVCTGKPLVYRPTDKGYLLESAGPDGKDGPRVQMPLPGLKRE